MWNFSIQKDNEVPANQSNIVIGEISQQEPKVSTNKS